MAKVILPRANIVRSFNQSRPPGPREPIRMDAPAVIDQAHCERVLLLEDEAQTNMILREYLECLGYRVVAVANGVDGLKEVIKSDFELVICDMMMPKLPGDMFYLAVQRTRPQLCNRFVFITGHQESPEVDAFIARTHSAILVKPFRLQQLEATLESILSRFPKKLRPISQSEAPLVEVPEQIFAEAPPETTYAPVERPIPEKSPSMVSKALKFVGFLRKPAPAKSTARITRRIADAGSAAAAGAKPPARITRRIASEPVQITRRIAHLASAPVIASPEITEAAPLQTIRVTRKIPGPAPTPPATPCPPVRQVTRRIEKPRTSRKVAPAAAPVQPKMTRALPKSGSIIRIEHARTGASATASESRVPRKIPAPAPVLALPRVSRKISDPAAAPKASRVTQKIAKVTIRVAKTLNVAPAPLPPPKVTAKAKLTDKKPAKKTEAPVVTRRTAVAKKS